MNPSQPPASAPDVSQLAQQTLAETAFPGGRDQPFRVWLRPEAHEAAWKHATEHSTVEICGVLVGKWARDADGPYVSVSDVIRGEAAASKFAEVTFTHETWNRINTEMDARFADQSIVGWYHSHPDFGVFLSDRDRFIQEHFFAGAGQIALVLDPVRKTEGAFIWQRGKAVLAPTCWVGNRVLASTAAGDEKPASASAPPGPGLPAGAAPAHAAAADDLPAWVAPVSRGGLYVVLVLLGFLLAGVVNRRMTDLERLRIEQDAKAWSLVFLNARPGLDRDLDSLADELSAAAKTTRELAAAHVKLAENEDEVKESWAEVLKKLERSRRQVALARAVYTLTPDEMELLLRRLRARGGTELPDPAPVKKKEDGKEKTKKDEKTPGDKKDPPKKTDAEAKTK